MPALHGPSVEGRVLAFGTERIDFNLPRLIEMIIEPAEQLRRIVDHIDISFGVEITEQLVGIFEGVDMANLFGRFHLDERALNRLCRPDMAGTG